MNAGINNTTITCLIGAAIVSYAAAFICLIVHRPVVARPLAVLGWLATAAVMLINWIAAGHPPFGNMYHVMTFLSLCFLPLYLLLRVKEGLGSLSGYFVATSIVPLIGALFMDRDIFWRRMPALQSPWFVPHVTAYMISYSLATVAIVLVVTALARQWLKRAEAGDFHECAAHQIMRLAFPFMTFGLLSGALWAEEAWGAYWSWDPKETWSLITWTLYLVYFHCRTRRDLQRFAPLAHICAFAALLVTFLLVNLLPKLSSALHSYATQ